MTIKRILKIIAAITVLAVILVGCSQGGELDVVKEETIKAKAGTWKTAQTIQPFFYGEFLPKNIEIKVLPFTNPGDQKTALLAGELDITGTTLVTAITAASKGEPIKIVVSLCNKCSALVVGKDSDIEDAADLKGKTIAYVPGTMHHALLLEVLSSAGLNAEKDVELVQIDFFDMGQALKSGSIDAFLSGEPYPSEAVLQGYGRVLQYPYFDDSIGTINAAMIVTEKTIAEKPGLVQALVNAHIEATEALQADQEKWFSKAGEFGTSKEIMGEAAKNIELCYDIDQGYIEHAKRLAEKMLELGIITTMPDIDKLFDLQFLENAGEGA